MREPYVPQEAHQRFLIEAWLFWGKNFLSSPLAVRLSLAAPTVQPAAFLEAPRRNGVDHECVVRPPGGGCRKAQLFVGEAPAAVLPLRCDGV